MLRRMRSVFACAILSCGIAAAQAPFVNVTTAAGISVPPTPQQSGQGFYRGAAWADFDSDGDMDLFAPGGAGAGITVYYNTGNGTFSAQPLGGTLPSANRFDHQCVVADVDNDGDEDVFVAEGAEQGVPQNLGTQNFLFINAGNGTFTEEATARGLADTADYYSASFFDYDRDGWIDLYVGQLHDIVAPITVTVPRKLYRNTGGGYFVDVTAASGTTNLGKSFCALGFDFDNDGWSDIVYGNDRGSYQAPPTGILRNSRNGTFTSVGPSMAATWPIDCMGLTCGDIENDGDWDIFMTNVPATSVPVGPLLLVRQGATFLSGPSFFSVAQTYGLVTGEEGWNAQFFDFDHDMLLDLWVQHSAGFNRLFKGFGVPPFADVTAQRGLFAVVPPDGAGCVVDFDNDGDLDIYLAGNYVSAQLLANPVSNQQNAPNWLTLKLIGTNSNRSAIGARVIAKVPGATMQRMVVSGEGFLCDGDHRLNFGLASNTSVPEIEIRWPSGTVQFLSNVAANQIMTVTEPRFVPTSGTLTPGSTNTFSFDLPNDQGLTYVAGVAIAASSEYYLPDNRAIRVDVNDPILALSTTFGNTLLGNFGGPMPANGANLILSLPPIPQLTGFNFWMIGVTVDFARPGSIKSIVGPQRVVVQ